LPRRLGLETPVELLRRRLGLARLGLEMPLEPLPRMLGLAMPLAL
jgi:hypothetical protein